jgi:hypothetical protein
LSSPDVYRNVLNIAALVCGVRGSVWGDVEAFERALTACAAVGEKGIVIFMLTLVGGSGGPSMLPIPLGSVHLIREIHVWGPRKIANLYVESNGTRYRAMDMDGIHYSSYEVSRSVNENIEELKVKRVYPQVIAVLMIYGEGGARTPLGYWVVKNSGSPTEMTLVKMGRAVEEMLMKTIGVDLEERDEKLWEKAIEVAREASSNTQSEDEAVRRINQALDSIGLRDLGFSATILKSEETGRRRRR